MAGTGDAHLRADSDVLLRVHDLHVRFGAVQAVSGVSFDVRRRETLALVGESGCGKSTTARAVVRLQPVTRGAIRFDGQELSTLDERTMRALRPRLQMIFQDPIGALNPRRSVFDAVAHGPRAHHRGEVAATVSAALREVGLDPATARERRPHQMSGGQAQRVAIARALVMRPDLLVCDEPVSALDVSVQAQILNLLRELRDRHGLSMLFISHDLSVVRHVSDRVLVMYLGAVCEVGDIDGVFERPAHHYTAALLASIPGAEHVATTSRPSLAGELPSPLDPPSGCRFHTRCPAASDVCRTEVPRLRPVAPHHHVACHHPLVAPTRRTPRDGDRAPSC